MLGIHDYQPSHFGSVLLDLARGQLPGFVQGGCDFVDVRDVAVGMIAAQQRAPSGSLYLLGGEYLPMPTVAQWVAEVSGKPAPRLIVPLGLAKALAPWAVKWSTWVGARPRFTPDSIEAILSNPMISHTKAERELGYHPRPLQESLRETLAWLLEHHPA
jgi:dihydroflavonol-4-reductase